MVELSLALFQLILAAVQFAFLDNEALELVTLLPLVDAQVDLWDLEELLDGGALVRRYLKHGRNDLLQILRVALGDSFNLTLQDLLRECEMGLRIERW